MSTVVEKPVLDTLELNRLFQVAVADPLQSSIAYMHNSMQQLIDFLRGIFGSKVQEALPPVSSMPTPMINSAPSYKFDQNRQIA